MKKEKNTNLKQGFTLLELLVVVLIIGILASIALPQYQVAVKKATLAKYMDIVKALKEAEDRYFLANGIYAINLDALDITLPINESCTKNTTSEGSDYRCGKERFGIFSKANAQAGNNTIRYLQFFDDVTLTGGGKFYKGDIVCYSVGETARKACQSFGNGKERPYDGTAWNYVYIINRSTED